jgi:hypothetical protein
MQPNINLRRLGLKQFYLMKKPTLRVLTLFIAASIALSFSACKKSSSDDTSPTSGNNGTGGGSQTYATLTGKVSTPGGRNVGYASVSVGSRSTRTNSLGEFSLTIPTGNQTVTIQTGNGRLFKKMSLVNLTENQSFRMADTSCVLSQVGNLLTIHGDYDAIEQVIFMLGYNTTIAGTAQMPLSAMEQFDAIFLNCTANNYMSSPFYQNLDTFVRHGGSIYASDWAVEYLTGNGVYIANGSGDERRIGHHVDNAQSTCTSPMLGGFIADSSLCTTKSGPQAFVNAVHLDDIGMVAALGKDSVDIVYDLGSWEMINLLDAPFVTTMHKTGFPGTVAAKADMSAIYPGAGSICYTTFHNNPQTSVSPDILTLLQYYILNL